MTYSGMASVSKCPLLQQCPVEIRLKIYENIFTTDSIAVEAVHRHDVGDGTRPTMRAIPMSSQLLRTCNQIHHEARTFLYATKVFDCSQREGIKLLLQNIGPNNFALIKHIKTDWDELQAFSWALTKEEYQRATRGLCCLEIATWRTKISRESKFLWKQVKSYERQLYESASDICKKHRNLKLVTERRRSMTRGGKVAADMRVSWRFISSIEDCFDDESIVSIDVELARMKEDQTDDQDREPNLVIDAF